jgi:hypothetical protein
MSHARAGKSAFLIVSKQVIDKSGDEERTCGGSLPLVEWLENVRGCMLVRISTKLQWVTVDYKGGGKCNELLR